MIASEIDRISIISQRCTTEAKEFMLNAYTDENFVKTGNNASFELFNKDIDSVLKLVQQLNTDKTFTADIGNKELDNLRIYLKGYKVCFHRMANLYKRKGFKDIGVEGKMREAIHFIEKNNDKVSLEKLLSLRRHEKDFLLRKDLVYVEKFDTDLLKLENQINANAAIDEQLRGQLINQLGVYKNCFAKIVDIEQQIGLTQDQGKRAELAKILELISGKLNTIIHKITLKKQFASKAINVIVSSIIIVFFVIIITVFVGIKYVNSRVIKPIVRLRMAAEEIANGNLSVDLEKIEARKLTADLVVSYEKLVDKLRSTISLVEQISSRKLKEQIQLNNDNDEIGKSLNRIITEMQFIDGEEKKRVWAAEGISKFSEIIRKSKDLNLMSNEVIVFLVKYLNANQGGVYILNANSEKSKLKLEAAYAYDKKKFLTKDIEIGEGLVGQCYREKNHFHLTEIPKDYLNITSGFGDANPRALLVVPMQVNDSVEAVIELASFKNFEAYQIDFLQKIGEIMASAIAGAKMDMVTNQLFEESKMQSEQMRAQEEEMRQNLEEMMATQEEIMKKEDAYKREIANLKLKLASV